MWQVWDLRDRRAVRALLHGPRGVELMGDAIDVRGSTILTASFRARQQLQQWDLRNGKLLREVPWHVVPGAAPSRLSAAQFSKDRHGAFVAAAGAAAGEAAVQIFRRAPRESHGRSGELELAATVNSPSSVFGLDWSHSGTRLAVATSANGVLVAELPKSVGLAAAAAAQQK